MAAVATGLLLAIAATTIFAVRADQNRRDQSDANRIDALKHATTTVTSKTTGRLQDLAAAVGTGNESDRTVEFERVAKVVITEPGIASVRLIERVESSDLRAYERRRGLTVTNRGDATGGRPDAHYISAAEAVRGKQPTYHGLDISGDAIRMRAIRAAIDTGRPAATEPIQLLSGGTGAILYAPVYRSDAAVANVAQRRKAAIGVVSSSMRATLLGRAIQSLKTDSAGFQITDNGSVVAGGGDSDATGLRDTINIAGREWTITSARTAGSVWPIVAIILLGGLALSVLIAITIVRALRREMQAAGVVEQQNAELTVANASLGENARFFELSNDLFCTSDFDGNMLSFNRRWTEVLGWTAEELRSLPVEKRVHPDDIERVQDSLSQISAGNVLVNFRNRRLVNDGTWRWLEWSCVGDPELGVIYSSARDVTDRVELEEELTSEHAQLIKAQSIANLGSWNYDVRTGKMQWSDELFNLLGDERPDQPLTLHLWLSYFAPDERDRARRLLTEMIATGEDFELTIRRERPGLDGQPVHLLTSGFAERDDQGKVVRLIGIVADITDRLRNEARLRYAADHDSLTGLANRRRFLESLEHHVAMCRRYGAEGAVMMLDLDGLKSINDEHGHAAGDKLIAGVAEALRNRLRTSDLGARIGGDEFAILLTRTTRKGALSTAESILKAIEPASEALREFGVERVEGSIGVVMIEDASRAGAEELLALADDTMYQAKRGGGARVNMYRPPMRRPTAA